VHKEFFKRFTHWYATKIFPEVVYMPGTSQEELRANSQEYITCGIPSAICSVDVMHIRLWGVSANLKQVCTGKEKFPSRAYELICNQLSISLISHLQYTLCLQVVGTQFLRSYQMGCRCQYRIHPSLVNWHRLHQRKV
jgi:hypothetical protein